MLDVQKTEKGEKCTPESDDLYNEYRKKILTIS